jgi:hypothetical protein
MTEKKNAKKGPIVNGGAVIIDDGGGVGGQRMGRSVALNTTLTSDDRLMKLADEDYKKDTLSKKLTALTITAKATGETATFKIEEIVSFAVFTAVEDFKCSVAPNSAVIRASAACMESGKYQYALTDSGAIKRVEVSLKVGAYAYEGSAKLKLEYEK